MSAGLCLALLRVSGAELLQLEGCLMLLSCRVAGGVGREGTEAGEPSDPRSQGCECVYIGLGQPAVSDFRPPLYQESFPWFSVKAGAGRELTPEPS